MANDNNEGRIAIVAIVIVVIAAFATIAISDHSNNGGNDDTNPNGILGIYEIVDYTQYGTDGGQTWKWVNNSTGEYNGEKIRINSYKEGTIRGTCYLGGDAYDIIGYYDPESGAFGYTSYYNYTPGGSTGVVDWLQGAIVDDTMYLHGYTVSANATKNPTIYTFNFTFVKVGKTASVQPAFTNVITKDMTSYVTNGVEGTTPVTDTENTYIISPVKYSNGVYELLEYTGEKKGDGSHMTATTIYQDSERTLIRAIGYYPGDAREIYIKWLMVEGNHMYCVWEDSNDTTLKTYSTLFSSDGTQKTYPAVPNLAGKTMDATVIADSTFMPYQTNHSKTTFTMQDTKSNIAVGTFDGNMMHMSIIPGLNMVAYVNDFPSIYGDVDYYGDVMGFIESDGSISLRGFYCGTNGETVYLHGTLKHDGTNPKILGTYEIVNYTQYGTDDGNTWKWVNNSTGEYDGEKICINSYNDGTIRGTCYLGGDAYDIIGYYDPDTGAFGYTSYYNYTPGGSTGVVDWLQGAIVDDTMYLHGYTVSANATKNPTIYTFNFTFVKVGKTASVQPAFTNVITKDMKSYVTYGVWGTNPVTDTEHVFTISQSNYSNGVYELKEKIGKTSYNMTATTIYQDSERTLIRAIGYYPDDARQIHILWLMVEGNHMYSIWEDSNDTTLKTYSTLFSSDGTTKTYPAVPDLAGKTLNVTAIADSTISPSESIRSKTTFTMQDTKSNIAVGTYDGKSMHMSIIPGVDMAVFFDYIPQGDTSYYGDVMGFVESDGSISLRGFYCGDNGETIYLHGIMKP